MHAAIPSSARFHESLTPRNASCRSETEESILMATKREVHLHMLIATVLICSHNMKREEGAKKASWGYVPLALFATGVLTFGFLDGFTAMLMMEKYGATVEFNPLMKELFSTLGRSGFLVFKASSVALLLYVPLLIYKKGTRDWTKASFLSVFTVIGAVSAMDNYRLLTCGQVWIEPHVVAGIFFVALIAALLVGDILDTTQEKEFKISDESWKQMKLEIGYP
jgi:hypothetical protein